MEEYKSTSERKEIPRMYEKVAIFIERKRPKKNALFNDTALTHFRNF